MKTPSPFLGTAAFLLLCFAAGAHTSGALAHERSAPTFGCPPITLSPSSLPGGTLATAYSQTITASGGLAPYTFAVTAGALPPGLSLASATGVLSGTPTSLGNYPFTVTATDSSGADGTLGCTGSQPYSIVIGCSTLSISPSSLPAATLGVAYNQTLVASGGNAPYTFAVTAGALPPGLGLNAQRGLPSATPSATETYTLTMTTTNPSRCGLSIAGGAP